MEEDRGLSAERLITFTDAVVAIAVTLLALPLGEIPAKLQDAGLGPYLDDKGFSLLGFVISFFVIARLWWSHHRLFQHVVRWDRPLVSLTIVWLFTVVLIAPTTALTNSNTPQDHPEVIAVYLALMTLSSALLTSLAWHIDRHPELTDGHDDEGAHRLFSSIETTISFAVALVIGTVFPQINYFALFTLAISGQLGRLVWNRRHPAS